MMNGKEMADIYIDAYKEALDRFYGPDAATQIASACLMTATMTENQRKSEAPDIQIRILLAAAAIQAKARDTRKRDAPRNPKKEDKKPKDKGGGANDSHQ
jgi:hypothetical protein